MSCAKTAEPIEMQLAMLSWVREHVLHGGVDALQEWGVWPIVNHMILGLGKKVSCAKY